MKKPVDTQCRAFQSAIELLSRPWNGLILGLLQDGPLRFSQLEDRSHGLGPKTLSSRLKVLEARGIIVRRIESGPPVRVHYALSAKGRAFGQVAEAIHHWGRELVADETPAKAIPKARRPRQG